MKDTGHNILVAGGTGLIGQRLYQILTDAGNHVHILTRNKNKSTLDNFHHWDPEKGMIHLDKLPDIHVIINLAGAGVMDKPWTNAYKKEILNSRLNATRCLHQVVDVQSTKPMVIAASAIGYYGYDNGEFEEHSSPAPGDFLQDVTQKWEAATADLALHAARLACIRIGIVLSGSGGALTEMLKGFKFGFGSYFSPGDQYYSWIHIDDLCSLILHIIQNKDLSGTYNGVAPEPVTAKDMTSIIARKKFGTDRLIAVPLFASKLLLGERHTLLTGSCKVSSKKIEQTGFTFRYPTLSQAIDNILDQEKN